MPDQIIRLRNVLALCKAETTEGVDSSPTASVDAFPFEIDSLDIGSPYAMEDSNEATGTAIAGAPLIVGQPVAVRVRFRLKGAGPGVTYTASVKPPSHALLQSSGLRGLFTAAVAAAALTAGSTTTGTLGTGFASTAQLYRGQRAIITGGSQAGAMPLITDYTGGKVATLTDLFGTALGVSNSVAIAANWTYAATSPRDATERATDHPSSTLYVYTDGLLVKLFGLRGNPKIDAQSGKVMFMEMTGTAIWGGQSDTSIPTGAVIANHAAPQFDMLSSAITAFGVGRKRLPVSQFSFDWAHQIETYEDPNTPAGFGAALIGGRAGMLECDPYKTQLAVRNHLADLESPPAGGLVGVASAGVTSGNRVGLCMPMLVPSKVDFGTRKSAQSETLGFRAMSSGRDSAGRDGDAILCFD